MHLAVEIVLHHLRIFGVAAVAGDRPNEILCSGGNIRIRLVHEHVSSCQSRHDFEPLCICLFRAVDGGDRIWARLRSISAARPIIGDALQPVVVDCQGFPVWVWVPDDSGGVLLIGTDLAGDLVRIRQGDPAASNRPTEPQWGIAGERPTYLFDELVEVDRPQNRMADWWLWTLRDALVRHGGAMVPDVLPFGAPGAVVVTGDDDQAYLDDYLGQAEKLGRLPVTYFLHPLTRHVAESLAFHERGCTIEWELHPDALDAPGEYAQRLAEQCEWFHKLTGRRPRFVRNHGFLNVGYWGHATPWLVPGVGGLSNLPRVDGKGLNGSLLPARLSLQGVLTSHWSQLTAFGDGVFFVYNWDESAAIEAIAAAAQRIIDSGVPGVLVFNLHPANHERAAPMLEAAHRLVESHGFTAMTLGSMMDWFAERDACREPVPSSDMIVPFSRTRIAGSGGVTLVPVKSGRPVIAGNFARRVLHAIAGIGCRGNKDL